MKQLRTLAAATSLLVACGDNPVAPAREAPAATMAPSLSVGASSTALDFTDLSNDVIARLLPSFENQQVAATIETSMRELNAHALEGRIAEAQNASQAIRSTLKEGVASTLLLDVMNRTLDVVERDLAAANAGSGDLVFSP